MSIAKHGARPGSKISIVGETIFQINPSFAEIVAVPIIHDWGPLNTPTLCVSFEDYIAKFGDSDTVGRTAVALAFGGQNLVGAAGAGAVLVDRMGITGAGAPVKATVNLQNTTPAAALTLTAKYAGVRGNRISAVVADDAIDATRDVLKIRLDGVVKETYYYANTDINGLRDQINANTGSLVTATTLINAVALGVTAGTSLATGTDGNALTLTEWSAMLARIQNKDFSIFAPYDLTDATIQASLKTWVIQMRDAGLPLTAIIGGGSTDTVTTAITRSATMNDQNIVNLGHGVYHDDLVNKDLSTSQLAPKIAGVLAARGDEKSLTFAKLGGLHVATASSAPADDQIISAIENGVTVFSLSTSAEAELKIERGMTTFTTKTDLLRPFDTFSDPRLVRILDIFARGVREWGNEFIIGEVAVNDNTRAAVRGEARQRTDDLEQRGLIVPDTAFVVVEAPSDPADRDAVPFDFGWTFTHTANYIRGRGRIR
ncbi:MAG: phage tail sheath family protein [Chloroflexi bacterium]|nr:phage tail sheath family protein [Chloroflexota bacterium]